MTNDALLAELSRLRAAQPTINPTQTESSLIAAKRLGGALLARELEQRGFYEHAGYIVTYTDDADLCAWLLPLMEDRLAEAVFDDGPTDAFAWLASRSVAPQRETRQP